MYIFSYFPFVLSTQFISYIDEEPTAINPTIWFRNEDDSYKLLNGTVCEGSFVIQFSIQYKTPFGIHPHLISKYYDLGKLKVSLKRFLRKESNEEAYNQETHQPECIELPSVENELYGFELRINKETFNEKIYRLKEGCQHVLLYYNVYDNSIESAITALRKLMKLEDQTDFRKFAYRFYIETVRTELNHNDCHVRLTDASIFFLIRITSDNLVYLQKVGNTNMYHIPKD